MTRRLTMQMTVPRVVALALAAALFVIGFVLIDYTRTVRDARDRLTHVGRLFNQTFQSSLALAGEQNRELILALAQQELTDGDMVEAEFGDRLRDLGELSRQVDALVLIAPDGTVLWSTSGALVGQDLSDRDYFQRARILTAERYHVGEPINSRASGRKLTPIAWPVTGPGQPMRGVLASSLYDAYFEHLLERTRFAADMEIDLHTADGTVAFSTRVRPDQPADQAEFGSEVAIPGSDLVTRVSMNRSSVLSGFYIRATFFALVSGGLFTLALAAAALAQRRSAALVRSLVNTRQEAENARQAREQFLTIFRNVEDGIVVYDELGAVAMANQRARNLLNAASDAQAIGIMRHQAETLGDRAEASATSRLTLGSDDQPEGESREIRCRISRVTGLQGMVHYCVLTDVSAEERLASARVRFVETINHELRTPLTSLAGSLNLLAHRYGEDFTPKARKLLDIASRNADRLKMLVNDILTLQSVDQGRIDLDQEVLSAREVVEEAVASLQGYAESFQVTLLQADQVADARFRGDRQRIQQVLSNLISNAIKYSPRTEPVIVGADATESAVKLWCTDRGPGIPSGARKSIFERFAKPAHDPNVQVSGTGLGLAITQELVQRQNGRMVLETVHVDEPGGISDHGSTFGAVFPLVSPAPSSSSARQTEFT